MRTTDNTTRSAPGYSSTRGVLPQPHKYICIHQPQKMKIKIFICFYFFALALTPGGQGPIVLGTETESSRRHAHFHHPRASARHYKNKILPLGGFTKSYATRKRVSDELTKKTKKNGEMWDSDSACMQRQADSSRCLFHKGS